MNKSGIVLLALAAAACGPRSYACGPYRYSAEEHRCVCPEGTIEREGGCEIPDGGLLLGDGAVVFDDAGAMDSGARTDAGPDCVPGDEICNGTDDDCDGETDEEASAPLCGGAANVDEAACIDGDCVAATCVAPWRDCNEELADGCETDVASSRAACGSCGNRCGDDQTCRTGECIDLPIHDWAIGLHDPGDFVQVLDVATDTAGNVYVVGTYATSFQVGSTTLTSRGEVDGFVASVSSSGTLRWAHNVGGAGFDYLHGVDVADGIFVVGSFSSDLYFDATRLSAAANGSDDGFVMALTVSGVRRWTRTTNGTGREDVRGVSADAASITVAGGYAQGATVFGRSVPAVGTRDDVFVVRFDTALGNVEWIATGGGPGRQVVRGLVVNAEGTILINGMVEPSDATASVTFGARTAAGFGANDVFAAALGSTLEWAWVSAFGSASNDDTGHPALWSDGLVLPITEAETSATPRGRLVAVDSLGAVQRDIRVEGDATRLDAVDVTSESWAALGQSCGIARVGTVSAIASAGCDVLVLSGPDVDTFAVETMVSYGGTADQAGTHAFWQGRALLVAGFFEDEASFGVADLSSDGPADAFLQRISLE